MQEKIILHLNVFRNDGKRWLLYSLLSLTILMICEVWQPDGRQSEKNRAIKIIWQHFGFFGQEKNVKKIKKERKNLHVINMAGLTWPNVHEPMSHRLVTMKMTKKRGEKSPQSSQVRDRAAPIGGNRCSRSVSSFCKDSLKPKCVDDGIAQDRADGTTAAGPRRSIIHLVPGPNPPSSQQSAFENESTC